LEGVLKYKKRNGFTPDSLLLPQHIDEYYSTRTHQDYYGQYGTFEMAVTRLYKSEAIYSGEHSIIYANLFQGKQACTRIQSSSRKSMNKTAVFSGQMNKLYLVPIGMFHYFKKRNFTSYRKKSNYLAKHDMEWVGRRVRQRPGPQNALGKVKFIFPNSHIIFMHDTPSKAYLIENKGPLVMVVSVSRPRDLAIEILKDDKTGPQKNRYRHE
jgi:hypothetical protein